MYFHLSLPTLSVFVLMLKSPTTTKILYFLRFINFSYYFKFFSRTGNTFLQARDLCIQTNIHSILVTKMSEHIH